VDPQRTFVLTTTLLKLWVPSWVISFEPRKKGSESAAEAKGQIVAKDTTNEQSALTKVTAIIEMKGTRAHEK
jgi:hypothetical protein